MDTEPRPVADGSTADMPRSVLVLLVGSGILIAVMASAAWLTHSPLVFPSLGPTALLIVAQPHGDSSRPKAIALGHYLGIIMGFVALLTTGLAEAPAALPNAVDGARVVAASLSVALTGACMLPLGCFHAPAGATTLIISLGLIRQPRDLLLVALAVTVLAGVAAVIRRLSPVREQV